MLICTLTQARAYLDLYDQILVDGKSKGFKIKLGNVILRRLLFIYLFIFIISQINPLIVILCPGV